MLVYLVGTLFNIIYIMRNFVIITLSPVLYISTIGHLHLLTLFCVARMAGQFADAYRFPRTYCKCSNSIRCAVMNP